MRLFAQRGDLNIPTKHFKAKKIFFSKDIHEEKVGQNIIF